MFLSDVSERRSNVLYGNTAVLYVCIRTIRMSTCFVYTILSEWIEVQEDLFVTFGQCISRQAEAEIKKRRY